MDRRWNAVPEGEGREKSRWCVRIPTRTQLNMIDTVPSSAKGFPPVGSHTGIDPSKSHVAIRSYN